MPNKEFQEVGFELDNGMKISLQRPGLHGESVMGEHLDLVVTHPNGSKARIMVTCSGTTDGDKYIEFVAEHGKPLEKDGHLFTEHGASFQPEGLGTITLKTIAEGGGINLSVIGVLRALKLNLLPERRAERKHNID